jgi:hypothetical protein
MGGEKGLCTVWGSRRYRRHAWHDANNACNPELIKRGIRPELAHTSAFSAKGPWRISHTPGVRIALNNQFFDRMGLIRLSAQRRI